MKLCKICKIKKELTEFHPCGKYKDKIYYRGECRDCNKIHFAEEHKIAQKKYKSSTKGKEKRKLRRNTDEYRAKARKYDIKRNLTTDRKEKKHKNLMDRLHNDPLYRLKHNMRNRVRNVFKSKKWHKDNSTADFIGCSLQELKKHIESKFTEGMSWENYGQWELDHIYPLSLCESSEEIFQKCHYTNLQPLWRIDNIKKSNKI